MQRQEYWSVPPIGVGDPNHAVRNYDLSRMTTLAGLLDHPLYPPYVRDTPHTHNCMEIGMCLSGNGTITVGGRTWRFSAGTVAVAPRGVPHAQQNEGMPMTHWLYVLVDTEVFLMETPQRRRADAIALLNRIPGGVFLGPDQASGEVRDTVWALFRAYRERKTLDSQEMDALTRLLLCRLSWTPEDAMVALPEVEPAGRVLEPALRYVSENYMLDVRVAGMAAACAMSESYFRKLFGRVMGMSPVEYLNRYRVNRSIYLLYATDETVLSVAGLSGFASIASYNRNFMKYVGVSPARWRANLVRRAPFNEKPPNTL